ncbi:MAG: TlyA family RNA methyltransferase, partial [Lachnospiraceae bacterium]|nr:TlyA family RNA methyltransferase [Lachnospiraceae bacterium]
VVRDRKVHEEVIEMVVEYAKTIELHPLRLDFSPVKGPEGNIEYLLFLTKNPQDLNEFGDSQFSIHEVVEASHKTLDKEA